MLRRHAIRWTSINDILKYLDKKGFTGEDTPEGVVFYNEPILKLKNTLKEYHGVGSDYNVDIEIDVEGNIVAIIMPDYAEEGYFVLQGRTENNTLDFNEVSWSDAVTLLRDSTKVENLIANIPNVMQGLTLTIQGNDPITPENFVNLLKGVEDKVKQDTESIMVNAENLEELKQQIDEALDQGDEAKFQELTQRYNQLRQARRKVRRESLAATSNIFQSIMKTLKNQEGIPSQFDHGAIIIIDQPLERVINAVVENLDSTSFIEIIMIINSSSEIIISVEDGTYGPITDGVISANVDGTTLDFHEASWEEVAGKLRAGCNLPTLIRKLSRVIGDVSLTLDGNNPIVVSTLIMMLQKVPNPNSEIPDYFDTQFDDDFSKLQEMQTLKQQIDEALDQGDETKFYELTERYNQLRQARRKLRRTRYGSRHGR